MKTLSQIAQFLAWEIVPSKADCCYIKDIVSDFFVAGIEETKTDIREALKKADLPEDIMQKVIAVVDAVKPEPELANSSRNNLLNLQGKSMEHPLNFPVAWKN